MMAASKVTKEAEIYQFKITLRGVKPPIWRRIQVPKEYSFLDLHMAIQDAMGWKDYHLHQFQMFSRNSVYIGSPSEGDDEIISGKTVKINSFFTHPKDKMKYEYDFGDGWEHVIILEKIMPATEGAQYPQCVAGKRACPPEDCGGVGGYMELLDIMANPRHEEYEENKEWLKGNFNPEKFDPESVAFRDPKVQ